MSYKTGKLGSTQDIETVYAYHDRTKHRPQGYARSPGFMDWANQPDPFRHYDNAPCLQLDQPSISETPDYDSLYKKMEGTVNVVNRESISRLFYESLALSAWKQAGGTQWSLRVNPSSGNLHPTEAYLVSGPIPGLSEEAAVYHYNAYQHALEKRLVLTGGEWLEIHRHLSTPSLLVALSSIYWRESWKYGERAFRYCHHDVGHAIAAITAAAALLQWDTRLVETVSDQEMASLLGIGNQQDSEAEHPDCLLAISAKAGDNLRKAPLVELSTTLLEQLNSNRFSGTANTLSNTHQDWPIIETVAKATRYDGDPVPGQGVEIHAGTGNTPGAANDRPVSARRIIRERRSAIAMDGHSHISSGSFFTMMRHVLPLSGNNVTSVLPWRARISLAIFIHRVDGLPPGLYLLVRDPGHEDSLRGALHSEFHWEKPVSCPVSLSLYLLLETDVRDASRMICCHQDIACDGSFALAMLAEFDSSIEQHGAGFYPRLFWEAGIIGQILYLEAEAAGVRGTGIGCFFDDVMHDVLGIRDHSWQSLYHFTVGKPVDDPRLQTLPPYRHLQ